MIRLDQSLEKNMAVLAKAIQVAAAFTLTDSATYAHPVITGNQILVKDESTVSLWSLK